MSDSDSPPRLELPPEAEPARAFIEALVEKFSKQIAKLEGKVAELEQKLAEKSNPRNSSKPPSSEHSHAKPAKAKRRGKKKKQGGQQGHARYVREPIPSEQCDQTIVCSPSACRRLWG